MAKAKAFLTEREKEVLKLILEGKSSKEVADTLYISKRTVDFHLQNAYEYLGAHSRMQAAVRVQALKITL